VTGLDWAIVAFALLMGAWGYRQGLLVGLLSVAGFAAGAVLGSRLAPALLVDGAESPYAPFTALAGALLIGGLVAVTLEGAALGLRRRFVRRRWALAADAAGGAALLAALGLALAWICGAVALNAPGAEEYRDEVQRSAILRALNDTLPPSGFVINALNRVDPGVSLDGPEPEVAQPDSRIAGDPEVRAAESGVVRVTGTACGLGVEGSGWIARPGLVVTNAHVVAGQDDTEVDFGGDDDDGRDATAVHYDPGNDLAILRVDGLGGRPLPLADEPRDGADAAVLGFPENGPYATTAARVGATEVILSEDSYGRGPVPRELTSLRGQIRSGNSGGPVVDADGRVVATVFASTVGDKAGGYAVPSAIVATALPDADAEVSTGPCT
jgi:S1-C subfamily serine protease